MIVALELVWLEMDGRCSDPGYGCPCVVGRGVVARCVDAETGTSYIDAALTADTGTVVVPLPPGWLYESEGA